MRFSPLFCALLSFLTQRFCRGIFALYDVYCASVPVRLLLVRFLTPSRAAQIINMVTDGDMWPAKIALPYRFTGACSLLLPFVFLLLVTDLNH